MGLFDSIKNSVKSAVGNVAKQIPGEAFKIGGATLGMAGGLPGAVLGAEYGQKVENFMQSGYDSISGKTAAQNMEKAKLEAERVRRESIIKQMGARQQAESLAVSGLRSRSGGSSSGSSAQQAPGGVIGANLSTSGTF